MKEIVADKVGMATIASGTCSLNWGKTMAEEPWLGSTAAWELL